MSTLVPEARFVEILSPDCSKANAIRQLAGRWGVDLAEVVAVGDNFNDLDMIEAAGLGVAMGNAPAGRARPRRLGRAIGRGGRPGGRDRALRAALERSWATRRRSRLVRMSRSTRVGSRPAIAGSAPRTRSRKTAASRGVQLLARWSRASTPARAIRHDRNPFAQN